MAGARAGKGRTRAREQSEMGPNVAEVSTSGTRSLSLGWEMNALRAVCTVLDSSPSLTLLCWREGKRVGCCEPLPNSGEHINQIQVHV